LSSKVSSSKLSEHLTEERLKLTENVAVKAMKGVGDI
jgi:hypothetical protein